MAEVDFTASEHRGARGLSGTTAAIMNWSGALLSVGLVGGLAVWTYQLTIRDVTEIPVIQALEGPMRVQPEDPGGARAAHQGLSVNEVQAEGEAAPPPDRLVLAPSPVGLVDQVEEEAAEPLELAEVDPLTPALEAPSLSDAPAEEVKVAALTLDDEEPTARILNARAMVQRSAIDSAVNSVVQAVARSQDVPVQPEPEARSAKRLRIIPAEIPGIARSTRPARRAGVDMAALISNRKTRIVAPQPTGALDLDPASLTPGTRLVQLGAYESEAVARSEWERISRRFSTYMEGRKRVIQRAESGGRIFYRLRVAGFEGLSDSRRFCSVLLSENAACIPVIVR